MGVIVGDQQTTAVGPRLSPPVGLGATLLDLPCGPGQQRNRVGAGTRRAHRVLGRRGAVSRRLDAQRVASV